MADSNAHDRADATIDDVAAHFGVSPRTVRRWIKTTGLPHRKVAGTLRFNLDEVDAWAARGTEPAKGVA